MKVTLSKNIFQDHAQLGCPKYGRNMKKHEQTTKRRKKHENTFRKYYIPIKHEQNIKKGRILNAGKNKENTWRMN